MNRRRQGSGPATEAVVPSTNDILGAVTAALRGDRKKIGSLVAKTHKRIEVQARKRVRKEFDQTLAQLRGVEGKRKQSKSPARAKGEAPPRGARLAAPRMLPTLTLRPVKIRLANKRWVNGHLAPSAARRNDLATLRRIVEVNTRRSFTAIQTNARAIDSLATSQRKLAKIVAELQSRGELALIQGLFDSLTGLEFRFDKGMKAQTQALKSQKRSVSLRTKSLRKSVRLQARSARIQKLSAAATTMQTAAFGTKGALLTRNNVVLAGNELFWNFFGDLATGLGLSFPGQTNPWAWLTPLASMVTGQVSLGSQQHRRFISGVATAFNTFGAGPVGGFSIGASVGFGGIAALFSTSLEGQISTSLWPSFRQRTNISVSTTAIDPLPSGIEVFAQVRQGVLSIVLYNAEVVSQVLGRRIAWMVDTGDTHG